MERTEELWQALHSGFFGEFWKMLHMFLNITVIMGLQENTFCTVKISLMR